jgi:hypothetical protein
MDPNAAWESWRGALARREHGNASHFGEALANWINGGGFEPAWNALERRTFFAWWDAQHDDTTVYHAVGCDMGEDCTCTEPPVETDEVYDVHVAHTPVAHTTPDTGDFVAHGEHECTDRCGECMCGGPWSGEPIGGRITCGDCGGTKPELTPEEQELAIHIMQGSQSLLDSILTYLVRQRMIEEQKKPAHGTPFSEFRCSRCGCRDVETTAQIHMNSDSPTDGEPPAHAYWCPTCEERGDEQPDEVCLVHLKTGYCEHHYDESGGPACKPGKDAP